ncbi:MAG: septal ring lytic transglycosylase RlpA family protein [Pseudomonadota bacterium]
MKASSGLKRLRDRVAALTLLAAAGLLGACSSSPLRDGPPDRGASGSSTTPATVPRPEALSRYGNGPIYEVLGRTYRVMESSSGFRERGVASWYGKKFHGRLTSNREVYDMYAMTAAHKTLPLPTWVEVRNLRNDKSVVVRVNDRGPFVNNRIIDLSYAAAQQLDMVQDGTSMVEVRVIEFDGPRGDRTVRSVTPPTSPAAAPERSGHSIFVQVGAFGSRDNAERREAVLRQHDIGEVGIVADTSSSPALYRVHIGPVANVFEYDRIVDELAAIGIDDPYLITR